MRVPATHGEKQARLVATPIFETSEEELAREEPETASLSLHPLSIFNSYKPGLLLVLDNIKRFFFRAGTELKK
jgi:hypothetical protein